MKALSVRQIRAVEQAAVDAGFDFARLMENAGSAAAKIIRSRYDIAGRAAVILCGNGNNGGDGFVIARRLANEGAIVTVILTSGIPAAEPASAMYSRLSKLDINILNLEEEPYIAASAVRDAHIIVDAVFGIGFHGVLPSHLNNIFSLITSHSVPVISVDIPSGMSADTGEFAENSISADITVTFTAIKKGMELSPGLCGEIIVASIGIDEYIDSIKPEMAGTSIPESVRQCFPPRAADAHKGSFGRLFSVCGSPGMLGAAVLSARAALRCGIGILEAAIPKSLYAPAAAQLCEPVFCLLEETSFGDFSPRAASDARTRAAEATALLIGCGLGSSSGARSLILDLLPEVSCPIILDADGINILAAHMNIRRTIHAPLIVTPHPGEMARLAGISTDEVQRNRESVARRFCDEQNATVVLKGYNTLIVSPGMPTLVNPTGNPGMATGGSGDVLAGMIASFAAQGLPPQKAAMCGAYLHGLAGDRAAQRLSQRSVLPSDIIDELSGLFSEIEASV